MTSPFDFINAINSSEKKDLIKDDPNNEKEYNSFLINRGLSYFPDTIMYANEMNLNHHLDGKLQFSFLLNSIRPKKRFSKWAKKKENGDLEVVMRYFGYGRRQAEITLNVLTPAQIEKIKQQLEKGGKG